MQLAGLFSLAEAIKRSEQSPPKSVKERVAERLHARVRLVHVAAGTRERGPTSMTLTLPSWKEQSCRSLVQMWRYLHQWHGNTLLTQEVHLGGGGRGREREREKEGGGEGERRGERKRGGGEEGRDRDRKLAKQHRRWINDTWWEHKGAVRLTS